MKERVLRSWITALMISWLPLGSILFTTGCGPAILSEEEAIDQEKAEAVQGQTEVGTPAGDDADDGGGKPSVEE